MRLLVTGGAGFIGSNFIRHVLATQPDVRITNLDLLTYAGNLASLADVADDPRYAFTRGDIGDAELLRALLPDHDALVNFAAESHVDRSITGCQRVHAHQRGRNERAVPCRDGLRCRARACTSPPTRSTGRSRSPGTSARATRWSRTRRTR